MAQPTTFPEATLVWTGPNDIGDLPAHRDDESNENISCWELSAEEIAEILSTGVVWLHVWGTHPPVCISGVSPFIKTEGES